jgi:hypothetical protein
MFDYVDKILTAFYKAEPKVRSRKTSAAPGSIFNADESCVKLAQNKAVEFHNLVAKNVHQAGKAGYLHRDCILNYKSVRTR